MVKRSKLVSVIIPTKNRKKMLLQTLKSVLFQKYKNLQVIIHDNNSLDNTYEYIKYLLKDKRIEYYNTKKDIPMWDNWNLAFGYVRGDYFLRLDDDNIIYKTFISENLRILENKKIDAIFKAYVDFPTKVPISSILLGFISFVTSDKNRQSSLLVEFSSVLKLSIFFLNHRFLFHIFLIDNPKIFAFNICFLKNLIHILISKFLLFIFFFETSNVFKFLKSKNKISIRKKSIIFITIF